MATASSVNVPKDIGVTGSPVTTVTSASKWKITVAQRAPHVSTQSAATTVSAVLASPATVSLALTSTSVKPARTIAMPAVLFVSIH